MIRCVNCGEVFEEEDVQTRSEYISEFWGAPAYMDVCVCLHCGSDDMEMIEDEEDEQ